MNIEFCVSDIDTFLKKPGKCPEVDGMPANKVKRKGAFSASPVSLGRAWRTAGKGTPFQSSIHYIKMSSPEAIRPDIFLDVAKPENAEKMKHINEGKKIAVKRQCERCKQADEDCLGIDDNSEENHYPENKACNCEKVNLDFKDAGAKLYAYRVWKYSSYLNNPKLRDLKLWLTVKGFNMAGDTCYGLLKLKFLNWLIGPDICSNLSYRFPHTTTFDQSLFSDQIEAFTGLGYLQAIKFEKSPYR